MEVSGAMLGGKRVMVILLVLSAIILLATYFQLTWFAAFVRPMKVEASVSPEKYDSEPTLCPWERDRSVAVPIVNETKKWILIYTTLFGGFWGVGVKEAEDSLAYLSCDIDNCRVTYNKHLLAESSAVVFHARDLPSVDLLLYLSRTNRPSWQRWAYHVSESPMNTPAVEGLDGLFNLTVTYELHSDIFMPYRRFRRLKPGEPKPDVAANYAAGKTKMAAWLVSNCQIDFRNSLVRSLELHGVTVSVGGSCRSRWPNQLECLDRQCEGLQQHRFFLALENGFCKDYISDKFWYPPFEYNMIPVVLGGADYENPCLVIPGSYINIRDFKGVSSLAAYLRLVASNDKLFNSYFDWKQRYFIYPDTPAERWPHPANFLCELCRIVHDDTYPNQTHTSISTSRDVYRACKPDERISEILDE